MDYQLLAILLYVATLLFIGVLASRRTRSMADYFAGGRRQGFWAASFSARATGESAWLLLGLTGLGAAEGIKGFWVVLGEVLGVAVAWLLLSDRFKSLTLRFDSLTVPDYLESRFGDDAGHTLRALSAGTLLFFVPIYVSAQIHSTGEAFNFFLDWNYYAGALFGFAVVLLYITRGGFIAVVWSDVFQGLLMVCGLVLLPLVGVWYLGGVGQVIDALGQAYPNHLDFLGGGGWTLINVASIIGLLGIGLGFMGSPQVFVRFIALRSRRDIPKGAFVAIVWTLLADSGAVLVGVVGRAVLSGDLGAGGQEVLPELVEFLMHPFVAGIYIAIVLSAIMSTIDSLLVVASSAAVRDYYQKIFNPSLPDNKLVGMSRNLTVVLAFAALAVALAIALLTGRQPIFWFVIFGWSGIAATFCPTIILSLFWSGLTARGAAAAMVAGFLSIPFFKFVAPLLPVVGPYFNLAEEMAPSFAVGFAVAFVVSKADPEGQAKLKGILSANLADEP
ncbi:MAG TPA: sodium/proline symporter [Acidobacteriota bacterium]|nr:sodium/proline symporter [Acidobacteriota bacterium]